MKQQLLFLTVFFSLLFGNVFSQTVYVTKTGTKYHKETCHYLSKSSIEMSLSDAVDKGYTACSVCKPASKAKPDTGIAPPPSPHPSSGSVQCSAITKAGKQCLRMTKSPNGKCWQHGGN